MATQLKFKKAVGLNAAWLTSQGSIFTDVDFAKEPLAAGDVAILLEIPKGAVVFAFGARLDKQQPPVANDATLRLYTEAGGVYTAVASGTTAAVDVDNTEGMLFSAQGAASGAYLANSRVFVGLQAGATTGTLTEAKLRVWAYFALSPATL
jgi:hypothetical protein